MSLGTRATCIGCSMAQAAEDNALLESMAELEDDDDLGSTPPEAGLDQIFC